MSDGKSSLEYDIIRTETPEYMIKRVNEKITEGWTPLGGICCDIESYYNKYMQVMTKVVENGK